MTDHDDDPSPVLAQAKQLRDLLCGEPPYELLSTTSMVQFAQRMAEDLVDLVMDAEREDDPDDESDTDRINTAVLAAAMRGPVPRPRAAVRRELDREEDLGVPRGEGSIPRCLGGMRDEGGVDLVGDEGLNL